MSKPITLAGPNSFALMHALQKIKGEFISSFGELAVEQLDGEESSYSDISDAMHNISFLDPNKLVLVHNIQSNKEATANLEGLLEGIPDSTQVVFILQKTDKRSVYYKLLKKQTAMTEFSEVKPIDLPNWIIKEVSERDGTISRRDAQFLVDRSGTNQMCLINEIDKLLSYNPQITQETIMLLCDPLPQSSVFDLLDAAFSGNATKAQKLYQEQRQQHIEPLAILGMIAWQLHIFAVVKTSQATSADEIARSAQLSPYVVKKSLQAMRRLSLARLQNITREALQLDVRLKSESIDADGALQLYLLRLAY